MRKPLFVVVVTLPLLASCGSRPHTSASVMAPQDGRPGLALGASDRLGSEIHLAELSTALRLVYSFDAPSPSPSADAGAP